MSQPDRPVERETMVAVARRRGAGLFLRGLCMGTADVIPGVSGGTMALITGIYDELVATIAGINVAFVRSLIAGRFAETLARLNAGFLLPLLTGIFAAVVSLAGAIRYVLDVYPKPSWGFLCGLILASAWVVRRRLDGWGTSEVAALIVGAALGYGVTVLVPMQTGPEWYKFVLSGAVSSMAMILPGISGSFLLVLLGKYKQVLGAIHERELLIILFFGCGFVSGILAFSRLLKRLLACHHNLIMALLVGLMLGSVRKVWPWRVWHVEIGAKLSPATPYDCILPLEVTAPVMITAALMIGGVVLVVGLERIASGRAPLSRSL